MIMKNLKEDIKRMLLSWYSNWSTPEACRRNEIDGLGLISGTVVGVMILPFCLFVLLIWLVSLPLNFVAKLLTKVLTPTK